MIQTIFFAVESADAAVQAPPFFLQPQFVIMIFMFLFIYFAMIRPQQKKQKDHQNMLTKLDKNDEVITAGGIHATVISVGDKTVTVRIADNVKVELEKSSVMQVIKSRA